MAGMNPICRRALLLSLLTTWVLGAPGILAPPADANPRPDTTITAGPSGTVQSDAASFSFSSNDSRATFECRLDAGAWTRCTSPRGYSALSEGAHEFLVRARDARGRVDRTPASRKWTIIGTILAEEPTASPTPEDPTPVPTTSLLSETFDGPDSVFASASAFWDNSDLGVSENPDWFAESGTMYRRSGTGRTTSSVFRMWTRRTDLAFTKTEMDIRFNGWTSGTAGWHGINLWLNRKLRSNSDGSRINDGPQQEGYVVDFLNRDGSLLIMKKVGDTYHTLSKKTWTPQQGQWYRWGGRVIDNGSTSTIQILLNGQVLMQATDNGSIGGPRLLGGRAGLRSDYSDMTVDNLAITRD
jgi:hypothetical protein